MHGRKKKRNMMVNIEKVSVNSFSTKEDSKSSVSFSVAVLEKPAKGDSFTKPLLHSHHFNSLVLTGKEFYPLVLPPIQSPLAQLQYLLPCRFFFLKRDVCAFSYMISRGFQFSILRFASRQ